MRWIAACIPVILSGQAFAASPMSEVICEDTQRMEQRLSQTLTSERRATGLRDVDQVLEVWTDSQGDWTLVVRYAGGTSCIVAMGEHWNDLKPAS